MKIMIVQATSRLLPQSEGYRNELGTALQAEGHKTQWLDLPSINLAGRTITNIASLRLLGTVANADLLLCLDSVAALLTHPRKMVVVLDDAFLHASSIDRPAASVAEQRFIANALVAAIDEAEAIFALSSFAAGRMTAAGLGRVQTLTPKLSRSQYCYPRCPGSELLVLAALTDDQRPELLIECLARLPEPFRARWVARDADPATLARMRGLAQQAGVEQRLAIDLRPIDRAERAYLIAQSAALIETGSNALLISDSIVEASAIGVPVVVCDDGGAANELAASSMVRSAPPVGAELARSVVAACAEAPGASQHAALPESGRSNGWHPLMKALRK